MKNKMKTHGYRMNMINQQCDRRARPRTNILTFFLAFLCKLLIKLHEKQGLVLNSCEEIVLSDKVKDIGATQSDEVG